MPKLSDSMEEATILRWLKQPGESFRRGDPLAEIDTDKATVVYEAEFDGVLGAHLVAEGESAAVGRPIARLGGGADATPNAAAKAAPRDTGRTLDFRTAIREGLDEALA